MLQCSIFASGDLSIAIDVFNIKELLNSLHAGSTVGLSSKDWEHTGVGSLGNFAFLEIALESIFESNKARGKNESTKGNGGEDEVTGEGGDQLGNKNILGSGGTGGVIGRRVSLFISFTVCFVIVVVEVGDQFDGIFTESISSDGNTECDDHA